jgi:hypothetical protein
MALKMDVIRSSETSVHIRTTRCYIPEDGDIRNYRRENLKSCTVLLTYYFSYFSDLNALFELGTEFRRRFEDHWLPGCVVE